MLTMEIDKINEKGEHLLEIQFGESEISRAILCPSFFTKSNKKKLKINQEPRDQRLCCQLRLAIEGFPKYHFR